LLRRFCQVVDVDPEWLTVDLPRQNSSLGHVQAELLRRVNEALAPELRRRDVHGAVGKRYFAGRILRRQQGAPARLHVRHRTWCDGLARDFVADLRAGGYDVVGDLDELIPADRSYTDDDAPVDDALLARSATAALAAMLTDEAATRRTEAGREPAAPEQASGPARVRRRLVRALRRQP
jgi:hypothetical protein